MPDKLYDYADHIKLRLVINLYCSRQENYNVLCGGAKWTI